MHYEDTYNALYVVMVMVSDTVRVKPNPACKYDYTALQAYYNTSMLITHYRCML